jgi:cyanophycin synthetase
MKRPDPATEIRLLGIRTLRGASFWSRRPVTRVDLAVGAYDEISSADVPGVTEALVGAFPGLVEHRCSVGERGGFIARLRDGTYSPHIMEHVALELQTAVGHDVGYGRARGGGRPGEYTVVFEHLHAEVGTRVAGLALDAVQRAFAGTLAGVEHAVAELAALAALPDVPALRQRVLCGVTGAGERAALCEELRRNGSPGDELVVDVAPAYLLAAGLPYASSRAAVILGSGLLDVPERYRDPERAAQLVSVVADGTDLDGVVVVPAGEGEVRERVRDAGRRVSVFTTGAEVDERDARAAYEVAAVREGRIAFGQGDSAEDGGALRPHVPPAVQLAAALTLRSLAELSPTGRP